MTAPTFEITPPPLVVGQEGWYVLFDYWKNQFRTEGRPAKVETVGKVWAVVKPEGSQTVKVYMPSGLGYRTTKATEVDGQWMTAEAYALWLAKAAAAADSERGELVEALRIRGVIVQGTVKTDVLPRLLAALEP